MKLDPEVLDHALNKWIVNDLQLEIDESDATELEALSIDSKTLCGTLRKFEKAVHLLIAVDHTTGCVLKQCRVNGKTNEHKAALKFLKTLVLDGLVVVADAMFTHRDFCERILDSGGDYFLPVKENHPFLRRDISSEDNKLRTDLHRKKLSLQQDGHNFRDLPSTDYDKLQPELKGNVQRPNRTRRRDE